MNFDDIEDLETCLKIRVPETKTQTPRLFVLTEGGQDNINLIEIIRKYLKLVKQRRPSAIIFDFQIWKVF